jgi:hypothetical protein
MSFHGAGPAEEGEDEVEIIANGCRKEKMDEKCASGDELFFCETADGKNQDEHGVHPRNGQHDEISKECFSGGGEIIVILVAQKKNDGERERKN